MLSDHFEDHPTDSATFQPRLSSSATASGRLCCSCPLALVNTRPGLPFQRICSWPCRGLSASQGRGLHAPLRSSLWLLGLIRCLRRAIRGPLSFPVRVLRRPKPLETLRVVPRIAMTLAATESGSPMFNESTSYRAACK